MACLVVSSCSLRAQLISGVISQCCGLPMTKACTSEEQAMATIEQQPIDGLILDRDGGDDGCARIAKHLLVHHNKARLILLSADPRLTPLRQELAAFIDNVDSWHGLIDALQPVGTASPQPRLPERLPEASRFEALRPRERTVLELLGAGLVSREIAQFMGLSLQTVETYRKSLSGKLGVSGSRLVRVAVLYSCLHLTPMTCCATPSPCTVPISEVLGLSSGCVALSCVRDDRSAPG